MGLLMQGACNGAAQMPGSEKEASPCQPELQGARTALMATLATCAFHHILASPRAEQRLAVMMRRLCGYLVKKPYKRRCIKNALILPGWH